MSFLVLRMFSIKEILGTVSLLLVRAEWTSRTHWTCPTAVLMAQLCPLIQQGHVALMVRDGDSGSLEESCEASFCILPHAGARLPAGRTQPSLLGGGLSALLIGLEARGLVQDHPPLRIQNLKRLKSLI